MTNEIEKIREDVRKYFDRKNNLGWTDVLSRSDYGLYYMETELYKQTDPARNWIISMVHIQHLENTKEAYEFLTNHDNDAHAWVLRDNRYYLIFPEAQGGQSIFDITEQKLTGFYSKEDPFIWIKIYVSPDKRRLAVEGCYWGCPGELVIYDCTNLTELPYPYVYRQMLDKGSSLNGWIDNETVLLTSKKSADQYVKI